MNCKEARALLLDAEPSALRPGEDSALAQHLSACRTCAQAARAILAHDAELHESLCRLAGDVGAPTLRAAPAGAARPRRFRQLVAAVVPLAAAAVLFALLAREPVAHTPGPLVQKDRVVTVNGIDGAGVAVMQTRNPDITVVWNY